mgnify:CR=1 FL=1
MKIGDLVYPLNSPRNIYGHPYRIGLVLGESFSSYNGALLQVLWPSKAHPMWEPKKYLGLVNESR